MRIGLPITFILATVLIGAPISAFAEANSILLQYVSVNGSGTGQLGYRKDFEGTLRVYTAGGTNLTSTDNPGGYNFLSGYWQTAYVYAGYNLTRNLVSGEQIKLCLSTDANVCSNTVTVETMYATLTSVKAGEGFVQWAYKKNYGTCAHPYFNSPSWQIATNGPNAWCQTQTATDFVATITQGSYTRTIVPGDTIHFQGGNGETSYGPVTVGTLANKVKLNYVLVGDGKVKVSYDKNFITCAHLVRMNNQLVHVQNWFCATQDNAWGGISDDQRETIVTQSISDFSTLYPGEQLKLCHGNNPGVCSAPINVTSTVVVPPESVKLGYVQVGGGKVKISYRKNFNTCVHLVPVAGYPVFHLNNHYCDSDRDVELSVSDSNWYSVPAVGSKVKLCHGNNSGICSAIVEVEALPTLGCQ